VERAILVRHGETDFSARGIASGRPDVRCPLSPRGVEQARRLGAELAGVPVDLCVTSGLERTRETADVALAGRAVPRLELPELNDPLYGHFEGGPLAEYLEWAHASDSATEPAGGGEARRTLVARYAAAYGRILERPERGVLVVAHGLPLAYVLLALSGRDPDRRVPTVEYARPYRLSREELERVVTRLETWLAAPTW
jgi:2,3-bisphosphoglycerate-dependent phosphoglycerate mutase